MEGRMSTVAVEDGVQVHYKDGTGGQTIVFRHGRPLDQLVPIGASAMRPSNLGRRAQLTVYRSLLRDTASTHHGVINAGPRAFFKA